MTNADIDYLENELHKITSRAPKTWPPPASSAHYYNIYTRLESLRTAAPPPPPPPPPSGAILFDGRAKLLDTLYSHEVTKAVFDTLPSALRIGPVTWPDNSVHYFTADQEPAVWNNGCLCFIKDDIALVVDPRYGKIYKIVVTTGDTNPWHGSTGGTANGAGQLSQRRTIVADGWTWFASAWKIDSWALAPNQIFFCDLLSLGYQTSSNDQVCLCLYGDDSDPNTLKFGINVNGGETGVNGASTVQGNAPGTTSIHKDHVVDAALGVWHEFCYGVKWATDGTGVIEIHHRIPGVSDWSQVYNKTGIDTLLWGTITDSHGTVIGNFPKDVNGQGVIDKFGLYFGLYGNQVATQAIESTGFGICSDLATAQATFPA